VSIALAFVLAVVLLSPRLSVNEEQSLLLGKANSQSAEEIFNRHKNFIVKNSDQVLINRFSELQNNLANKQEGESKAINSNTKTDANNEKPSVLILAFIVTELQEAFSIAAIILLPLLVIDLVIVNIFQLLAIRDYEPVMVALPLKLIIFYMVDGWGLISEKLINGYI
jgi:flagellar biosynthesis protein FliP